MLHGDCQLSKVSPVAYLESFLQQYAPACKQKWVVLDQGVTAGGFSDGVKHKCDSANFRFG